ncbi:hypothetical protein N7G274_002743 [Stereocaulon virgatum]|uniref:SAP domain-containing protein n=1 Tax=Stereocaulon virgatum TaxID=373712 RepID=A0ABR4AGP7_9LECA
MPWDYQSSFLDYKDAELHSMLRSHGKLVSGRKNDKAARMEHLVEEHPYLTTPWNIKSSYHDYRKVELSLKLKERNLLDSGTKAAMAERMQAFDDEHPFPFLKLPPELRNKIYKLAATQYYFDKVNCDDDRYMNAHTSHGAIWQPGLIRCNKQLSNEGRLFFFQLHEFVFDITYHKPEFLAWFDVIGEAARREIRHLTLDISFNMFDSRRTDRLDRFVTSDVPMMDKIHASVSPKAVVTWRTQYNASSLSRIHDVYLRRHTDPKKTPVFRDSDVYDEDRRSWLRFDLGKCGEGTDH